MQRRGRFQDWALGAALMMMGAGLFGCGASPGNQSSAIKGGNGGDQKEDKSQGDVSHTDLVVGAGQTTGGCPGGSTTCFSITSEKVITHVFVKTGFDGCASVPFTVRIDGKTIDESVFHTIGGPCNAKGQKGEDVIDRDLWFPTGEAGFAEPTQCTGSGESRVCTLTVCVSFADAVPTSVIVGAKSAEECKASYANETCENCEAPEDAGAPPDMCPPSIMFCPTGTIPCGGVCVDWQNDPFNCGGCGVECVCPGCHCAGGKCAVLDEPNPCQ